MEMQSVRRNLGWGNSEELVGESGQIECREMGKIRDRVSMGIGRVIKCP